MSQVVGPKGAGQLGASTGSSRADDVIVAIWYGALGILFGPPLVLALIALPGYALVFWIAEPTGLLAAWSGAVAAASAGPATTVSFAAGLFETFIFALMLGLILALPRLRASLERYKIKWLAKTIGAPDGVAAFSAGFSCIALHVLISGAVAAAMASFGFVLPAPPDLTMILPLHDMIGGGGPPGGGDLGSAIMLLWVLLVGAGIAAGIMCGAFAWFLALGARGAASGAAAALGAVIAHAMTRGEEQRQLNFLGAIARGAFSGAATGALYTLIVFAGAAAFGIR